ncbi:MAG: YqgE/AlgH family protein [Planctomycetes bacterium]|nr:YqgE/AlgH family protein [Planctomycetota bacterium]
MDPAAGALLVASPQLTDPNFHRCVIYLVDHGAKGTLGFIINRPLDVDLRDIWSEVPAGLAGTRAAAEGGPVERDKGLLLHGNPDLPGAQVMGTASDALSQLIVVGGEVDALAVRFEAGCDATGPRLFLGHSGWLPGQLDQEIREGAWIIRPGRRELLLDICPVDDLWQMMIDGRVGGLPSPSLN